MINKAFRELYRCLPLMGQGLRLVWGAARGWTVAWGVLLLLQGLMPAALVYLTRLVVNRLSTALTGQVALAAFADVWFPALLIGLLWVGGQLLTSLASWVRTAQAELVQDSIHSLIHQKALELDVAFYENPESYDLLHRARVDAITQPIVLLESLGTLVQNSLTLLVLAGMLAAYAPWLPLLLIGSALPGLWTVGRYVLRQHRWRTANTANERRTRYYDWILTERNSAAEMRLFGLGDHHRTAFQRLRTQLRAGRLALARDEMRAELAAGAIAWLGGQIGRAHV